ncbi:piggyBac transposable element-derived protein 4-like [Bombus pascuorum]|uniref:piggyBac transposable element-derived protein 4-like n=1 Tax=Bombus pascuorum TaxID=65598 RepID=UPI00298DC4C8|nr:piggyBac transposable element-derived protein 4-like [Bombus pascuorum]
MLHLNKNASKAQDFRTRVQKVNNFIEYLDEKFREYFVPGKEVSINEAVVKVKGRITFINYNPQKPTKWGIRIFVLADAKSAYVYDILPYYGELTSQDLIKPDLPVSSRIVLHLCNKLLHSIPDCAGYHVYTDRYCPSLVLAEELLLMKCHITGTIQKNRKHIPQEISNPKFINSNTIAMRHSNYLLLAWKDKRIVTMLSMYHTFGSRVITRSSQNYTIEEASKPNVIADYTSNKGDVDKADQYASKYCFLRKSLKWWRKLFFWGLETSVINAYILYKISQERKGESALSHYKEQRLDGKLHIINQLPKGKKKKCLVCSPKGSNAVKKQTVFYCETCECKPDE